MKPLCLVFDIDDTLYLERDYVRSGFEDVGHWAAKWLKIPDFYERAWELFEQGHRCDIFDRLLQQAGFDPRAGLVQTLVWLYRAHKPRIVLLPDALHLLASIQGRMVVAVVTDGPLTSQSLKAQALGLDGIADPIVITDQWGEEFRKPHPRAFEFVRDRVLDEHMQFVYVGDNPMKDFAGPRDLGWVTIRVRRPGGLHYSEPNSEDCPPDFEVSDLTELPSLLMA
jgi:putative hydrolase of the HAD superfamily